MRSTQPQPKEKNNFSQVRATTNRQRGTMKYMTCTQYSGSWAEVRLILHVMEIFPPRQSKVHATPIECTHEKATKHVTGAANTGMVRGMINQNVELKMTN